MKTINFAEQFVPLIESGRKTQTRRLIEPQPASQIFSKHGCWNSAWLESEWISDLEVGDIFSVNGTDLHCEITAVRVERVQDISQEDAEKEGFESDEFGEGEELTFLSAREQFCYFWSSIYPHSLDRNDWVWVYEFRKVGE